MKRLLAMVIMMVAAVLWAAAAFQAPDLKFTHYTTADGLPSNCVRAIAQDEEGFVWFGSDGGLVRFDGTSTKVFIPEDQEGTSDMYVLSLCRYGRGLLVGTDRMLYRYDPATEALTPMDLKYKDNVKTQIADNVYDIATDSKGNIWVAVERQGVFRIEPSGVVTDNYQFAEANNYIGDIYVDPSDMVWALSNIIGGGIYRFDPVKGGFREFKISDPGNLLKRGALAMTADSHGDYWIGTWENGLVKVNPRTGEARQATSPQQTWDLWHIHSLTEYSPTTLLVGSDSGLTLVETATGACKVYKADELDPQSLSDRFVYPVIKDSDGGIWVGTYYHGVNYVSAGSQRFRSWKHSRFVNSMSGNVVMALCEDGRGNLWIGTADGGLCVYNPENDSFRDVTLINTHEPENVSALCADDGRLWVGTYSMGAGWLDLASGRWTPVALDGHRAYSCYAIHKDSKGRVWMGATETFSLYNPEKNSFAPVKQMHAWINAIVEDKAGRIWVSTPGDGLYCYDADAGTWGHYVASKAPGSLPNNHINSVKVDSTGDVLVTTSRGIYKYE
ncbi:MAG: hypothetical protein K2J78_07310, partial [Muribaculaceae bacterium]|nr:hypothetical protein [Muribaculaceae bacterium]